jgi:hypothetical protein
MSTMVKETSIVMATSCAFESAFSIAGYLQRKARSSFSSKALRHSLLSREADKIENLMNLYCKLGY